MLGQPGAFPVPWRGITMGLKGAGPACSFHSGSFLKAISAIVRVVCQSRRAHPVSALTCSNAATATLRRSQRLGLGRGGSGSWTLPPFNRTASAYERLVRT